MCRCGGPGIGHIPVILTLFAVITVAVTYILAVRRGDVDPIFPYISDAGAKRPESCIFGQLLNICSFLAFVVVYVRYRLVREFNRGSDRILLRVNQVAFGVGCLVVLGISLVANFQENSVFWVHVSGALMTFIGGVTFCLLHTAISYRMWPLYNGIKICRIRLGVSTLCLLSTVVGMVCEEYARYLLHGSHFDGNFDIFHWKPTDPGFSFHVASAVAEWLTAALLGFFYLTFVRDFEKLHAKIEISPLVQHLDETPAPSLMISDAARLIL